MDEKRKNMKDCDCKDYVESTAQINYALTLAWAHGFNYSAKSFKYCPWCGKELEEKEEE
jgi:transcriptional antiterminator Rof (Rho-off)